MALITTGEAAEIMLKTGGYFTAASLGKELGITAKEASGLLYNIRVGKKYKTVDTGLPNRKVMVVSIAGRRVSRCKLWRIALGFKV